MAGKYGLVSMKVTQTHNPFTGEAVTVYRGVDPNTLDRVTVTEFESKPRTAYVERRGRHDRLTTGWIKRK